MGYIVVMTFIVYYFTGATRMVVNMAVGLALICHDGVEAVVRNPLIMPNVHDTKCNSRAEFVVFG